MLPLELTIVILAYLIEVSVFQPLPVFGVVPPLALITYGVIVMAQRSPLHTLWLGLGSWLGYIALSGTINLTWLLAVALSVLYRVALTHRGRLRRRTLSALYVALLIFGWWLGRVWAVQGSYSLEQLIRGAVIAELVGLVIAAGMVFAAGLHRERRRGRA